MPLLFVCMDPLTQAGIAAAFAVAISCREQARTAAFLGAIAGAVPDLDVLIRSGTDPLMSLQYHRHFSHALITAPLIGICVAAIFKLLLFWSKVPFRKCVLYAVAGALTHGLVDACTSYGTLLYWPFSNHRESWDLISIIDPVFTLPLVLLTFLAFKWRRPFFAQVALVFCLAYLGFCGFQRAKALEIVQQVATQRGHEPEQYSVRPSFANSILWRTVYRFEGHYYVDAVWTVPGEAPRLYPGHSVGVFTVEDAAGLVAPDSVLGHDIERFRHFSQGYLYRHPQEEYVLGDLRYAIHPDSIVSLWGIRVDPTKAEAHAELNYFREVSRASFVRLWKMIRGQDVEPLPLKNRL